MSTQTHDIDRLMTELQATSIFQGLDEDILARLAHGAIWREYAPGAVIFLEGDAAPAFYYVQTGWVKVIKMSPDGREQILFIWGPGEIFGGIGIFVNQPAPATAIALEPTALWLLHRDMIRQVMTTNPALALYVIEFMANRINELVTLVAELSLQTVTARFARLLLDEANGQVVHRQRWATQAEMAARLGTVPDVFSRALRSLVEEGLIQVQRHQIQILDRQGLENKTISTR